MSNLTAKNRASNLKRAIDDILGTPIKLSQAYELLAREEGYKNWDTASAFISKELPACLHGQKAPNPAGRVDEPRRSGNHAIRNSPSSESDNEEANRFDALPGLLPFSANPEADRPGQIRRFLKELSGDASSLRIACVNPREPDLWFSKDSKYIILSKIDMERCTSAIDIMGVIGRRKIDVAVFDEISEQTIFAGRELMATGYIVIFMIRVKDVEFGLVYSLEYNLGGSNDFLLINNLNVKRRRDQKRYGKIINPLETGTSKQICSIISSFMHNVDMWSSRSRLMLAAVLDVLCDLRDSNLLKLDVESLSKLLSLDELVKLSNLETVPDTVRGNLRNYLNSIPHYNDEDSLSGSLVKQCYEQHGYLTMLITKVLSKPHIDIFLAIKMLRLETNKN